MSKAETVFLESTSKDLILRPLEEDDIEECYNLMNNPEIRRFISRDFPLSFREEKSWFEALEDNQNVFVFSLVNQGDFIGTMELNVLSWPNRLGQTGAAIKKDYWGKGYGTEAKMLLLNYAFNNLDLRKINSSVLEYNKRSLEYLKKCGYKREGKRRKNIYRNGEYHDLILMGLLREDWVSAWEEYKEG